MYKTTHAYIILYTIRNITQRHARNVGGRTRVLTSPGDSSRSPCVACGVCVALIDITKNI